MNLTHYVPPQAGLLENPRLSIARFGIRERMPPQIVYRPAGNTDYLLMLFHTPAMVGGDPGAGEWPADTFILWEPGRVHYYGNARRYWEHSWIHCGGSVARDRIRRSALPRNSALPLREPYLFERFLQAVQQEITAHANPDIVIIASYLRILLRELQRSHAGGNEPAVPLEFLQLKAWLDTHYQLPLRLAELASRAFLSVPRFCVLFKRCFGTTAIEYVLQLRMQHAAFLLRDVNLRVTEVAHSVGYLDLYYFSKLFRRYHGLSPRAYRRRMRA